MPIITRLCETPTEAHAAGREAERSEFLVITGFLPLQQVDGLRKVSRADMFGQCRVLALEGQVHFPCDAAIAEVAGWCGAKFADVLSFGEVHFEEAANARGHRKQVEGRLGCFRSSTCSDSGAGRVSGFDGGLIVRQDSGFFESGGIAGVGRLIAMERGESLLDLRDATVPMHVAKAADVHEDVKAKGGTGMKRAKSLVVAAAMLQAKLDDLRNTSA